MWLHKNNAVVLVPDTMPDTIKRCLREGWAECPPPIPQPEAVIHAGTLKHGGAQHARKRPHQ